MRMIRLVVPRLVATALCVQALLAQVADDARWSTVPGVFDNSIHALSLYNGELIAGGFFQQVDGLPIAAVARRSGSTWVPLNFGVAGGRGGALTDVLALHQHGSLLFAGGDLAQVDFSATQGVGIWNGSYWSAAPGLSNPGERIGAMVSFGGQVYASGVFFFAGGQYSPFIAQWNGSSWQPLGAGGCPFGLASNAFAMTTFGGELIAGAGLCTDGSAVVSGYDGTSWRLLGNLQGDVFALTEYQGRLIAGGSMRIGTDPTVRRLVQWDGASWSPLPGDCNNTVRALAVLHGKLFVAGEFTMAGGVAASRVAQWNGTAFAPLGSGVTGMGAFATLVSCLVADGDSIVVGGLFTGVGHHPSTSNMARWDDPTDLVPPAVVITTPVDGAIVGTPVITVSANVVDPSSTNVTSLPSGVVANLAAGGGTASGAVTLMNEGSNQITVSAIDAFGNVGAASISVIRDTAAPVASITNPPEGAVFGTMLVPSSLTVADLTATTVQGLPTPASLPAGGGTLHDDLLLNPGTNTIEVTVTDAAGHATIVTRTVVVDLAAPDVVVTTPTNGACFGVGEASIAVSADVLDTTITQVTSEPAGVLMSLPAGGGTASGIVTLVEGSNVIQVLAVDATARQGSASVTVVLDTTPPNVELQSPAAGSVVRGTVVDLHVAASDVAPGSGVATVNIHLDGQAEPIATLTSWPFETALDTTALSDGLHSLQVRAVDGKGNGRWSPPTSITVDNTRPQVSFALPAPLAVVSGTFAFAIEATDAGSGVISATVTAGGQAPVPVDPSFANQPPRPSIAFSGSEDSLRHGDGMLVLSVRVLDAAGNEATADLTVTVDNAQPPTCALTPTDGQVVSGIVPITATVEMGSFSAIEIRVDGVSVAQGSSTPLLALWDSRLRLDGTAGIEAIITWGSGQTVVCRSAVQIDNLAFELTPAVLNLRAQGNAPIAARIEGASVGLLMPTEMANLRLRVAGSGEVPATTSWHGDDQVGDDDQDLIPELRVRFERRALANAIAAALANGTLPAGDSVQVELWARAVGTATDQRLGSAVVKIVP